MGEERQDKRANRRSLNVASIRYTYICYIYIHTDLHFGCTAAFQTSSLRRLTTSRNFIREWSHKS